MGQKHKRFREFWTPFLLRVIRKDPRSMYARVEGDGAICSKNRKIVPYHGANPNTRNGACLRSPSPIMAPDTIRRKCHIKEQIYFEVLYVSAFSSPVEVSKIVFQV